MTYTIQISDVSQQSRDIINMLISLSKEQDFVHIVEQDNCGLTEEQERELDRRFDAFQAHPRNGNSWESVKNKLL